MKTSWGAPSSAHLFFIFCKCLVWGAGGSHALGIESEAESQGRGREKMSLFTGADVSQGALRLEIIEEKSAHARVTGGAGGIQPFMLNWIYPEVSALCLLFGFNVNI